MTNDETWFTIALSRIWNPICLPLWTIDELFVLSLGTKTHKAVDTREFLRIFEAPQILILCSMTVSVVYVRMI